MSSLLKINRGEMKLLAPSRGNSGRNLALEMKNNLMKPELRSHNQSSKNRKLFKNLRPSMSKRRMLKQSLMRLVKDILKQV